MSDPADIPLLERPAFFDGQRLSAADLGAAQAFGRELRWLHNRSLHGWGIALGMAVAGTTGARAVRVQPGYAIDSLGRDIVLQAPADLPIPARAGATDGGPATFFLTASYADDAQLTPVTQSGACGTGGAVRRPDRPSLRWQDPSDSEPSSRYRYGLDVVLGEIQVRNCELTADVSGRGRRDALPPQQPYISAGRTELGKTPWRLWPNNASPFGVSTFVSTVDAGFRSVPRYQAHVQGDRLQSAGMVDGSTHLQLATATGFELRVILPVGSTVGSGQTYLFSRADYGAVVTRIWKNEMAVPSIEQAVSELLRLNGPGLAIGQQLLVESVVGPVLPASKLVRKDFEDRLKDIALRNATTLNGLVASNGWNLDALSLALDMAIAIPGPALALNPPAVLKPEFMQVLTSELAWHVVWMGVEG